MSDFSRDHNRVVWFDLPVVDLDRATAFYRAVLALEISVEEFNGVRFAVLDHDQGNGGCLVVDPDKVTDKGPLMYFNVHGRLQDAVEKVESQQGTIDQAIHSIGPHGFRAVVLDSEGNRIALHSET